MWVSRASWILVQRFEIHWATLESGDKMMRKNMNLFKSQFRFNSQLINFWQHFLFKYYIFIFCHFYFKYNHLDLCEEEPNNKTGPNLLKWSFQKLSLTICKHLTTLLSTLFRKNPPPYKNNKSSLHISKLSKDTLMSSLLPKSHLITFVWHHILMSPEPMITNWLKWIMFLFKLIDKSLNSMEKLSLHTNSSSQ